MTLSPGSKLDIKKKANATSLQPKSSIALIPFVKMSGEKEGKGQDERLLIPIRYKLNKIAGLEIRGRTSTYYWYNKGIEPTEIGKKLGVENILEGSVRREENRLSITTQLVKVSDGSLIWSERYDRDWKELSSIQDEIYKAIITKLKLY
jgi:adenylate cyclase